MFEMVVAGIVGQGFFDPLGMIGAIVLGQGALPPRPTIGLATVVPVALIVHVVLPAAYGAIFGGAASFVGALRESRSTLIGAASVFGVALWLVNFYVIAPALFPWFLTSPALVQLLAHAFFGTALGMLLASREGDEE